MAQTDTLVQLLKHCLKTHGKTYADIATELELSEASIKRLFAEKQFTLQRLEQICQMIDMEISDLVALLETQTQHIDQLSKEQEQLICGDISLLLVTVCVLNRWTYEEIIDFYHISSHSCIQHLATLDRLGFIELLPNNRIKLKISANFSWLKGGPIQQFFQQRIANEYFNSQFNEEHELLIVSNGMLSMANNQEFQRKMQKLAKEFSELNKQDASLTTDQRNGITLVLGMRHWQYGIFKPLIKT